MIVCCFLLIGIPVNSGNLVNICLQRFRRAVKSVELNNEDDGTIAYFKARMICDRKVVCIGFVDDDLGGNLDVLKL